LFSATSAFAAVLVKVHNSIQCGTSNQAKEVQKGYTQPGPIGVHYGVRPPPALEQLNRFTTKGEYRGLAYRNDSELKAWLARRPAEMALEPDLPIIDRHHHFLGQRPAWALSAA
jgi:hypothetical protein